MEKLTKEQANLEAKKIYDAWKKECEDIEKESKENGIWFDVGLDANSHLFKQANKRAEKKLEELKTRTED